MATMQVDVVSAERSLFTGPAQALYARSLEGEIGILPGHQPALLALGEAPVRLLTDDGEELEIAVHHGFLEYRDDQLIVLADIAEMARDIDLERARQAKRRAEQRLAEDAEDSEAKQDLARAQLRIVVAERRQEARA